MNPTIISLIISIGICFLGGYLGSRWTYSALIKWYPTIIKPTWIPPNWVFAPIWTLLYLMMAIAAWLVWIHASGRSVTIPLTLFFLQLTLNIAWSGLFFHLKRLDWALIDIVLLWLFILLTTISFWKVLPLAGWLMVPYLLWVSFATYLNFSIWKLNQGNFIS